MSLLADVLYLQEWSVAIIATISVLCFVAGAAHSGWVILWTQQMRFRGSFGFSMWLEAVYLLIFGWFGIAAMEWDFAARILSCRL